MLFCRCGRLSVPPRPRWAKRVRSSTSGVVHERIRHGLDERAVVLLSAVVLEELLGVVRVDFGDADKCLPEANLPPIGGPHLRPKALPLA